MRYLTSTIKAIAVLLSIGATTIVCCPELTSAESRRSTSTTAIEILRGEERLSSIGWVRAYEEGSNAIAQVPGKEGKRIREITMRKGNADSN